jgi:uncharacterized protein (TIGR02246 family)
MDKHNQDTKEITMRVLTAPLVVILIAAAGCTSSAPNLAEDEAAIRQIDSAIVAAGNAHDIDAALAFFADDARMLPPGAPPLIGKEAIRDVFAALMSPEFAVAHRLEEVVVSQGGDLAYVSYSYELTYRGPEGTPVTETGKDISIYKKVADGSWKLAIDMWSTNEPMSPST